MKNFLSNVLMVSAVLLFFSCSSDKKTPSADDVLETDSIMVYVGGSSFSRDDLTKALSKMLKLDYDNYILEVQGNEVKLKIRVRGHSSKVSDSDVVESLKNSKLELALFDDNRTEIGNQRLELSDITMSQIIDWTLQNDYSVKKEILFICKDFSSVEDLKKVKDVKIYAVNSSGVSHSGISNEDDSEPMSDDDGSSIEDDDDDDSESVSRSSGSEDWDSVLDSYERYVDKYISYLKKAQNGDASALDEYPSLLEEAQEYGEKLQNAKGDLSASQISRLNRINIKMMKAAQ